jgi:16S rRNA C967 or C1407 C5-methylase (RsmB/RsmF family)/NOL1/NOP2/fmu family ribosome biogenesis protein
MQLPESFKTSMVAALGDEAYLSFEQALELPVPVSVRIHRHKFSGTLNLGEKVPWCPEGYYLNSRPSFTLDPAFHSGAYYVQEASSMSLWALLDEHFNEKEGLRILDLCGAPGGKSSLIADWLDGKGLLVSNEVIRSRAYILKHNLIKTGYSNIIVTQNDPSDFINTKDFFDVIVVDAPCSGEGMFRKDENASKEWSPENVGHCSLRQKRILTDIYPSLKPGGVLIYSTCTFNDIENIQITDWLCFNYGMKPLSSVLTSYNGIKVKEGTHSIGYQFFPHLVMGEGLFIAAVRKMDGEKEFFFPKKINTSLTPLSKEERNVIDNWIIPVPDIGYRKDKSGTIHAIPEIMMEDADFLTSCLRLIHCGIDVGKMIKDILIPDHHLALSFLELQNVYDYTVDKSLAIAFLKKELNAIENAQKGWIRILYNGNAIGWVKNIGNRINNYLPNDWRIRMQITKDDEGLYPE